MKLLESKKRVEISENPSHTVPPHKKTRDLPNLTECHACGFKIDVCTGTNRLRPLFSEWRVVLLCKKCFSSVQSSQICSYCFSGASPESYSCNQCRHSVHKACFLKYKNAAPWSYACLGSEFSVCVDCWIPEPLAISRRRKRTVRGEENGRVMQEKGSSRVLKGGKLVGSMGDFVGDANCAVEEKVEAVAKAREGVIKKVLVARRAVELANNALSLVANRKESSPNLPPKMDAVKVLDGSELTELHPHLNSLPRISKSCSLLNTSYLELDTRKKWVSSVGSSGKVLNSRNTRAHDEQGVSNDNKLLEDSCKSLCEPSVSVGFSDSGSSTGLNLLSISRSDVETSSNDGERTAEFDGEGVGEELLKEGEGSCSDRLINFSEDSGMELDCKLADSALHREELCNGRPDRYIWKYSRRNRS